MAIAGVKYDGVVYDGMHSLSFGSDESDNFAVTHNTWTSWALIPTSKPVVALPAITSEKFVDIPGMHGSLDLSDYINGGRPTYGDRTGAFDFIVLNRSDFQLAELKNSMASYLSSGVLRMRLEDERYDAQSPGYYYRGRFKLAQWQTGADYTHATIEYRLEPFRYSGNASTLGDFTLSNQETSTSIAGQTDNTVNATAKLINFATGDSVKVTFAGTTVTLNKNKKSAKLNTSMPGNVKTFYLSGTGTVRITYKAASL